MARRTSVKAFGQGLFTGLCFINSIDHKKKIILGSLLLLGHPKNDLMTALFKRGSAVGWGETPTSRAFKYR